VLLETGGYNHPVLACFASLMFVFGTCNVRACKGQGEREGRRKETDREIFLFCLGLVLGAFNFSPSLGGTNTMLLLRSHYHRQSCHSWWE